MASPIPTRISAQEYLAIERASDTRHEFVNGEMYAMAGASLRHNRIARNLIVLLGNHFRGSGCEVLPSDMRVKVSQTGMYTYPDLTVVCGEPVLEDDRFDTLLNPLLIIEVMSASTANYDRGAKFAHYRRLESLRTYLVIEQDFALVELFSKGEDGWSVFASYDRLEQVLKLGSPSLSLLLADIYEGVPVSEDLPKLRIKEGGSPVNSVSPSNENQDRS